MKLVNTLPVVLAAALVVASCGEEQVTPTDPSFAISDGAHQGNNNFFFLPPMVSNPTPSGTFDGSRSPEVEICVWDGTICGATLAIFNVNAGPQSETVRVNTVDEFYIVNWHTGNILDNFTLGSGETFRLRVTAEGQELGFADIAVVGAAKELKNVLTDEFIPLKDGRTLPIKFRIEEGALAEEGGLVASAGLFHSCAVANDGRAFCWGRNFDGQLGIGFSGGNFNTPQLVTGGQTWQSVQASTQHTCGLTTGGQMYCWGRNSLGQLGIGVRDFAIHPTPLPVVGGHTFQSVASLGATTSLSNCGVTTAGAMFCWGLNSQGQLGNGTVTFVEPTPLLVTGGHTWAGSVGMERRFTCGLTTTGDALCWGTNDFGQLGRGTITPFQDPNPTPALVVGGHTFQSVSAGTANACGLTPAGVALCWGRNLEGDLGIGTSSGNLPTPQFVTGGHTFTQLSSGNVFTCGVRTDGAGLCWGLNRLGQLGLGTFTFTGFIPTPGVVVGGHTFQAIGAGSTHACGVTTVGGTFCWGRNVTGELGNGTFTPTPPFGIATPVFAINLIAP